MLSRFINLPEESDYDYFARDYVVFAWSPRIEHPHYIALNFC